MIGSCCCVLVVFGLCCVCVVLVCCIVSLSGNVCLLCDGRSVMFGVVRLVGAVWCECLLCIVVFVFVVYACVAV